MALFERLQGLCVTGIVGVIILLAGCSWDSGGNSGARGEYRVPITFPEPFLESSWVRENPCGFLRVERPLVNVTGVMNTAVQPGSKVRLYIARNTSLDTALFTVAHCAVLMAAPVDAEQRFTLPYLSAGEYVVMLPREAFGEVQGFPIVPAFNASGLEVRTLWHGGNYAYSMAALSVRPAEDVSAGACP